MCGDVYRAHRYPDRPPRCGISAVASAGDDETVWVQTSYLIAEIIIIPLLRLAGTGHVNALAVYASAAGFTLMSLLCGWAEHPEHDRLRALQDWPAGR